MRYAVIRQGFVVNVIAADAAFAESIGAILCPDDVAVGWSHDGQAFSPPAAPALDRTKLVAEIDDAVAAIYTRVGRFSEEYKLREAHALAFQASGHTGAVPRQIAAYATPAGLTPEQATTVVLAQAAQLRGALDTLGELRMRKISLTSGTDASAAAIHAEVMAAIRAIGAAL